MRDGLTVKKTIPVPKQPLGQQLHDDRISLLQRYCLKVLGTRSLSALCAYEFSTILFGNMPGCLGYALRRLAYPRLFRQSGPGLILGKGLTLRHPARITLGQRVAIDDYVMLDASGAQEGGIEIGDDVIISRNCVIQGKTGPVRIGNRADIGCNVVLASISGISIGEAVLIAGNCYFGGGRYFLSHPDQPVMDQGGFSRGPVSIGANSWLGAGVIVLDGVRVGRGCVIGAGALVTRDLPDYAIAMGVPARVVGLREGAGETAEKETGPEQ